MIFIFAFEATELVAVHRACLMFARNIKRVLMINVPPYGCGCNVDSGAHGFKAVDGDLVFKVMSVLFPFHVEFSKTFSPSTLRFKLDWKRCECKWTTAGVKCFENKHWIKS